ncbi:MAG: ABC transporter permease [Rhodothermaceae bacterium]|nr:ABC transporter permease [Rhodothermaceae bacterium]
MRRLLAALRWEAVLQARGQFYTLTAVVAVVWIVLVRLLPAGLRTNPEAIAPAFTAVNLQVTAFFFVTALVLLEKSQGALRALVVSPLRPSEYLGAKVLSLAALGTAENAVIVAAVFGVDAQWGWLLLGMALLGAIHVLLGLVVIARYDSINTFLMPSVVIILALSAALLGYYEVVPPWMLAWHPVLPPLVLMRAGWMPLEWSQFAYGLLGSAAWIGLLSVWARRRFVHLIAPSMA